MFRGLYLPGIRCSNTPHRTRRGSDRADTTYRTPDPWGNNCSSHSAISDLR